MAFVLPRLVPHRVVKQTMSHKTTTLPRIGQFTVTHSSIGTALFQAVLECRMLKMRFLLQNISRNICNDLGQNLLMTSLLVDDTQKRRRMFGYLMKKGVNTRHRDPSTGRDVLGMAASLGRTEQVRSILEENMGDMDITEGDVFGRSPLHLAVLGGHLDVVNVLLGVLDRYRLSVDIPDYQGLTPYMHARKMGRKDIARILVERGNACVYRRDTKDFRSAEDWENVGIDEDVKRKRGELKRTMEQFKISGVLPRIDENQKLNAIRQQSPLKNPIVQMEPSLVALDHEINDMNPKKTAFLGKSVDTAFTLLGLQADESMAHAMNFVQSQVDTTKFKVTGQGSSTVGQLSNMMQVLSEQLSLSFRKVAVKPRTPPVKMKAKRAKVSTLAVLLANEKRRAIKVKSISAARTLKKSAKQIKDKKKAKIDAAFNDARGRKMGMGPT